MTSKRTSKTDAAPVAGSVRRTRGASATHSRKTAAPVEMTLEAAPPDTEAIARLAYSYWENRGYTGGNPEEDWLRAEQELLSH